MRFTINREQLIKPLQLLAGIVEKRKTHPILANILIKLNENQLLLTATDLEIQIDARLSSTQRAPATSITVPGRKLLDICKALPDHKEIICESRENNRFLIQSGTSRFTLLTLPAAEFPQINEGPAKFEFSLTQQHLKMLIEQTHFAMAQQDARSYLNGMLFEINAEQITAVASDGHRLALSKVTHAAPMQQITQPIKFVLPRKGVVELLRILEANEQTIDICLCERFVRISNAELSFTSKLVESDYPEYRDIIPKSTDKIIIAEREPLKQLLMRIATLLMEKYKGICLQLRTNQLRATAHNTDNEEAEDHLPIQYQGPDFKIGFNVSYLLDVLTIIKNDSVKLGFNDSNSSMLIEENNNSMYIIMPMRL